MSISTAVVNATRAHFTITLPDRTFPSSPALTQSTVKRLETKKPSKQKQKKKIPLLLTDGNRQDLERKLGHVFQNPNLLWEALQASGNGVTQIGERKIDDGNKKMAMLGDTILQLALLLDWFEKGKSRREGNTLLCHTACNRNLDKCGREVGLETFINPNLFFGGMRNGKIPPRTMTATVEALIGAVFLDSGESLRAVKGAMRGLGLLV